MKPSFFEVRNNRPVGNVSSVQEYRGNSLSLDTDTSWSPTVHEVDGVPCSFGRVSDRIFIKVVAHGSLLHDLGYMPSRKAEAIALEAARYYHRHLPLIVPKGTELLGEMESGCLEGPIVARGQSGRTSQYLVDTPWGLALQELTQPDEVCLNTKS